MLNSDDVHFKQAKNYKENDFSLVDKHPSRTRREIKPNKQMLTGKWRAPFLTNGEESYMAFCLA
jgi:hypothetical protein